MDLELKSLRRQCVNSQKPAQCHLHILVPEAVNEGVQYQCHYSVKHSPTHPQNVMKEGTGRPQ